MTQSTFDFVRDNIAMTPFHQWLVPELVEVNEAAASVSIRLTVRPEFWRLPESNEVHGGLIAALVDIAGHATVASRVLHTVPTINMRVDYLRLAKGPELMATGKVVKLGRTIGVVDVSIEDSRKALVAVGRASYLTTNG
jgi:uncharacterized protein (TIGR00369 family)